ncbi:unnamed protein product [Allacma fusca]|uniref:Uncharacterized protein n=1 Tax=Allacma fusca TaxID=39272 RepID=A0A8J2JGP6_9HEXA|nr:unnamed protein product [Allacma fusca]
MICLFSRLHNLHLNLTLIIINTCGHAIKYHMTVEECRILPWLEFGFGHVSKTRFSEAMFKTRHTSGIIFLKQAFHPVSHQPNDISLYLALGFSQSIAFLIHMNPGSNKILGPPQTFQPCQSFSDC